MSSGAAVAKKPSRAWQINEILRSVKFRPDDDLANDRSVCAKGLAHQTHRKIEAGGTPMPSPLQYCTAVIKESARRGALADLYANMAIHELTGTTTFHDIDPSAVLKNREAVATLQSIQRAAITGQQNYQSVKGRTLQLRPELAVDAGVTYGFYNDRQMLAGKSEQQIDQIVEGCYDETATSSTRDCVMAGVRLGQRIRKQVKLSESKNSDAVDAVPAPLHSSTARIGR